VTDRETGRSRGFGFVEMADAIAQLDGREMGSRALRIHDARPRERRSGARS